jgi:hypothetical protein
MTDPAIFVSDHQDVNKIGSATLLCFKFQRFCILRKKLVSRVTTLSAMIKSTVIDVGMAVDFLLSLNWASILYCSPFNIVQLIDWFRNNLVI